MYAGSINWVAVLVAGLCSFVGGGIWYSPGLFGNVWMKDNHLTRDDLKKKKKGKIFGWVLTFSLLMATNLAMFLAPRADCMGYCIPAADLFFGARAGFIAGIWAFCAIAIHSLFEQKTWRLILINGFYCIISLTVMGAIIGLWR